MARLNYRGAIKVGTLTSKHLDLMHVLPMDKQFFWLRKMTSILSPIYPIVVQLTRLAGTLNLFSP